MNIVISGPCGVGKTTVAKTLTYRTGMEHIDFDGRGIADLEKRVNSPFASMWLNLRECLPLLVKDKSKRFVLDFGFGNIFRSKVDNSERLDQVRWLKQEYSAQIVVLTAKKDIVQKRFNKLTNRYKFDLFDKLWMDWLTYEKSNWRKCADLLIDTSSFTKNDTRDRILIKYKKIL